MSNKLFFVPLFSFFFLLSSLQAHEPLIFHHVPKNGGTTLRALLEIQFRKSEICPKYFWHEIVHEKNPEWYLPYKLIWGHHHFHYLRDVPGKRITFLREPIQRVLSAHQYWSEQFTDAKWSRVYAHNFSIALGDPLEKMQNHQTLFLSSLNPRDASIPIEKHLESAKANLQDNFFFVGITEKFDEGVQTLFKMLEFDPPPSAPTLNSSERQQYEASLIETLKTRNAADIELYEFARDLYEKKFAPCQTTS